MKPATPKTERPPSTQLRKAVFGGALILALAGSSVVFADSLSVNPSSVGEGTTVTISFFEGGQFCFPGSGQDYTLYYGDGTLLPKNGVCGQDDSFVTTHPYLDNNSSNVFRLQCGDAVFFLTVTNVPPTVSVISNMTVMTNQVVSNLVSFTDPGRDTWTAAVNYGDGSPVQNLNLNTNKSFYLNHAYALPGTYNLAATVTDKDGDASTRNAVVTVTVPPPPPQLTIIRSGANVILTWPTNAAGFALQSTTNLVSPAVWSTVSPGPTVVNGQKAVTNSGSGTQKFYRLSQ